MNFSAKEKPVKSPSRPSALEVFNWKCSKAANWFVSKTARIGPGPWRWACLVLLSVGMAAPQDSARAAGVGALLTRAVAAYRQGNDESALALFSEAIDSGNRDAYEGRAHVYYRMGDYPHALADLNQCLHDHVSPNLVVLRGRTELALGEYTLAEADFNLALKDQPTSPVLLAARGDCRLYCGQARLALKDYHHAIDLGCTNAMVLAHCGELEAGWDHEYRRGIKLCLDAIRSDKACWLGYNNLAAILATAKPARFRDGPLACINARQACNLTHWNHPLPLSVYAAACAEIHDFADAIRWQQQAINLELSLGDPGIHQALNDEKKLQLYQNKKPFRAD